ncbi:MAG: RusA family crossover junction endodeoxyribonuclease [Cetobacterium sp.]|uniref:RusA family crossover junction endodeoxyribonuclease n=1 Tax=Cetobacterium sp. TaxID=2071632 RepID=UPI003F31D679
MADYDFTMPWPPTINHWHQPWRGRIIKGAKARKYESDAVAWLKSIGLNGERLANDLRVKLTLHPPTNARYDIDNRTKGVFDSLSAADFWVDDSQVVELSIAKGEKVKGGMVEVSVTML